MTFWKPFWHLGSTFVLFSCFPFLLRNSFCGSTKETLAIQHLESSRAPISTYHVLFSVQLPFGELGAFFLAFRDSIFASREHLRKRFWHFGSTLGSNFGTSGAPWEAILAPRDHPGGPWEQQDGHEVANNRIFVDLGVILGLVYVSFWSSKCVKNRFIFKLVSRSFVYRFLT